MNEPDERFIRLCHEFPRVCIGSMGNTMQNDRERVGLNYAILYVML